MKKKESFYKYKFNDWSRDFTALANPLILVFVPFIFLFPKNSSAFYVLLLALLANEIIGSLIKIFFPKKRPNKQTYSNIIEKIDAGSFPSLHSSRICLVYLSLFYHADHLLLKAVFLTIIPIVMLSRVHLKKHFYIDIIGGGVIGTIIFLSTINLFNFAAI